MARPAFPENLLDFASRFATEESCYAFVFDSRWPDGFRCPKCGYAEAYPRPKRKQVECGKCGHCASVTAGTVMSNTKIPLRSWLWAAWLTVTSKGGLSAAELARQIGAHPESAFTMLHKLRHAMVAPARGMLKGRVEIDETYVGGPEPGKRGRGAGGKAIVIGAVEDRGEHAGRLRLRRINTVDSLNLHKFVREVVEPGSTIVTDGNPAYRGLDDYKHVVEMADRDARTQDDVLRFFHLAVSNLKTWLKGTHHGRVESKHLQAYLDEFVFRYNRRRNLGGAVQTLLGLSSRADPLTYDDIYGDEPRARNPGVPEARKARR